MRRRGFTLIESVVAIGIFVAVSINIIAILGKNTRRIYESRLTDEMIELADELIMKELNDGYTKEETETDWDYFFDENDEVMHAEYVWRMTRQLYSAPDRIEGSESDDLLRPKVGYLDNPYMELIIEVQMAGDPNFQSDYMVSVHRIIPPPNPIDQPRQGKIPEGSDR